MGLIRTLLAIAVLIGHAGGVSWLFLPGGMMAVQAFYIISGFYMALILSEKYIKRKNTYQLFISNRFLRIFPVYWIVLFFFLIVSAISYYITNHPLILEPYVKNTLANSQLFILLLLNLVVLGQDLVMFLGLNVDNNFFFLTSDFHYTSPPVHKFLLIQPSWTIALEFTFYLIAPYLVKLKSKILITLIFTTFAFRFVFYWIGFYNDPWFYRFFPFELGFFLTGVLAYRIYKWYNLKSISSQIALAVNVIVLFVIAMIDTFPGPYMVKCYIFYLLIFFAIPFIFMRNRTSKVDNWIGEFSYPLYICHYPLLMLINSLDTLWISKDFLPILLLLLSVLFSFLIIKLFIRPLESFRQKRVRVTSGNND